MFPLAELDKKHVWHPFTQMQDWLGNEPIVITSGEGSILEAADGRTYLDANSSIWTNLHGHRNPTLDKALRKQLGKVAHTSFLGLANEPASILAGELVRLANPVGLSEGLGSEATLSKVFFSDDGSTAMEVALKQAYEFARRSGLSESPRFLSLDGAYHGDTLGAVSLGHIDLFHKSYANLLFPTDKVMSPYCYRCPFNRAKPERADARTYRVCGWECVSKVEEACATKHSQGEPYAAMVVEPGLQGAAGMLAQPEGWLGRVSQILRQHGTQLIADEVMTGFGRATVAKDILGKPVWFASHAENVQPDYLVLAKGLTGGYLPMAATLTRQEVFDVFLGQYEEFKTFFHGHSYTGNALGSAVAIANVTLLEKKKTLRQREELAEALRKESTALWDLPQVGDIRQSGLVLAIELVEDWKTRKPFSLKDRVGFRVCEALARRGVLTRPIGNVIVVMPPYCTTPSQVHQILTSLHDSILEVFPPHQVTEDNLRNIETF